ncbi:uncharacterized protein BDCG_16659 [Blastomyces dermatitidis ER-3]|uniref:Uncharacterized protein n=1 Tax=Ajellomyces dermatitidis (strain ER-3 / ATCC MYA-2586) TaxID=559297 RepID=A0ABX2VTM5_AJEDR|nr:uncharacterized protein BDCG_16659 [Blastomyces dermatitidis ER-3]OAT00539.1 hypothetical protein BDCG_16659 [Blastomyces dermatitidis ER-3]
MAASGNTLKLKFTEDKKQNHSLKNSGNQVSDGRYQRRDNRAYGGRGDLTYKFESLWRGRRLGDEGRSGRSFSTFGRGWSVPVSRATASTFDDEDEDDDEDEEEKEVAADTGSMFSNWATFLLRMAIWASFSCRSCLRVLVVTS